MSNVQRLMSRSQVERHLAKRLSFAFLTLDIGHWTLDVGLLLLATFNKLLCFIEPALVSAILISGRSLNRFNTRLH